MSIAGVLFDLEGVLLRAKTHERLPGAVEALRYCHLNRLPFGVISNNTVQSPQALLALLRERGLEIDDRQILTPLKFLEAELAGIQSAMVVGSDAVKSFVEACGVTVTESSAAEMVICGGGFQISTSLLNAATTALLETKARFVCLHRNRIFHDVAAVVRPDVGVIVVGLEYATGVTAKTLGKPSPEYFGKAIDGWGLSPQQVLLISDDPISDLGGGKKFGFQTGFVHTGKYGAKSVVDVAQVPDFSWASLERAVEELASGSDAGA